MKTLQFANNTPVFTPNTADKGDDNMALDQNKVFSPLLSVPFYVHEDLIWTNATVNFKPVEDYMKETKIRKHTDDYLFMLSALEHPMRVMDPTQAKLFLATPLLNFIASSMYEFGWIKQVCFYVHENNQNLCDLKLLDYADQVLAQSPWFQRKKGMDHVIVSSQYFYKKLARKLKLHAIPQCHTIIFEDRVVAKNRLNIPSMYVGNPCDILPDHNKTHDFAMVARMKTDRPNSWPRKFICDALKLYNHSYSLCGEGEQCPALSIARFGFHVRGDTYGSNRLMDTLLSGTVPIFTHQEQKQILPKWIDWDILSYQIDVTRNNETLQEALYPILQDSIGYTKKRQNILRNQDLFDYNTPVPFDMYMYMFQRAIFPNSSARATSSPYNALILTDPTPFYKDKQLPDHVTSKYKH